MRFTLTGVRMSYSPGTETSGLVYAEIYHPVRKIRRLCFHQSWKVGDVSDFSDDWHAAAILDFPKHSAARPELSALRSHALYGSQGHVGGMTGSNNILWDGCRMPIWLVCAGSQG